MLRQPSAVVLGAAACTLIGCGLVRIDPPREVTHPSGVSIQLGIEYARVGDRSLALDLYRPEAIDDPLPVIIWLHGGGWRAGDKHPCPLAGLANRGYAVVSVGYRLTQEAGFPAQIHDCKAAVRFLRANAEQLCIDPDRMGLWGGSAGGHLVALLGTTGDGASPEIEGTLGVTGVSSRVSAAFAMFPVTDLRRLYQGEQTNWKMRYAVRRLLRGTPMAQPALAHSASPVSYVSPDDAPFMFVHGRGDPLIPVDQSELLSTKLVARGVPSEVVVLEDFGHGNDILYRHDVRRLGRAFMDHHLRPGAHSPTEAEAHAIDGLDW